MPSNVIDAVQSWLAGFGLVPAAGLAIVLLVAPTAAWLVYRGLVQPRTSRYAERPGELLWVCADCRSVNRAGESRCYACGLDASEIVGDLEVFDGHGIVVLPGDDEALTDDGFVEDGPAYPAGVPAALPVAAAAAAADPRSDAAATTPMPQRSGPRVASAGRPTSRTATGDAPAAKSAAAKAAPKKTSTAKTTTKNSTAKASTAKTTTKASTSKTTTAKTTTTKRATTKRATAKPATTDEAPPTPQAGASDSAHPVTAETPDGSESRPLVAVGPGPEPRVEPTPAGSMPVAVGPGPANGTGDGADVPEAVEAGATTGRSPDRPTSPRSATTRSRRRVPAGVAADPSSGEATRET